MLNNTSYHIDESRFLKVNALAGPTWPGSIRNLDKFTWEAWVKPDPLLASDTNQRVYSEWQEWQEVGVGEEEPVQHARLRFSVTPVHGLLRFSLARVDGTSQIHYDHRQDGLFTDDQWHHIAFTARVNGTFSERKFEIYLDGVRMETGFIQDGSQIENEFISDTPPRDIIIGMSAADYTTWIPWYGKIDCVRIWSEIVVEADLAARRSDFIPDPDAEPNLIEEWRLPDTTATTAGEVFGAQHLNWSLTNYQREIDGTWTPITTGWVADRPFIGDGLDDLAPPTMGAANAPTDITQTSFRVSWGEATDDVYIQYYELTVATDAAFSNAVEDYSAIRVDRDTSADITDLLPNTNYYWRVRAFDAAGNPSDYVTYNDNAVVTTLNLADVEPPSAPVALAATGIETQGFTLHWEASTDNVAVTGYRLDVATDEAFTEYVVGYQYHNLATLPLQATLVLLQPDTPYYYRLRAYDAAGNVSVVSNVVTVRTAPKPDTTAPEIVDLLSASSVESRRFTANWLPGIDDVGVVGYRLDVSRADDFSDILPLFDDVDVGDVTSTSVTGLQPATTYYYRVRAYDAAQNAGGNPVEGIMVATRPALVSEGEPLAVDLLPNYDGATSQASPAETNVTSATLQVGNVAGSDLREVWLQFDLRQFAGLVTNANLNLYIPFDDELDPEGDPSDTPIEITIVHGSDYSELATIDDAGNVVPANTITYGDRPVSTGTPVTFTPSIKGWRSVSLLPLLTEGLEQFTLRIAPTTTPQDDTVTFASRGDLDGHYPFLALELDQRVATEIESVSMPTSTRVRRNLLKNPSVALGVAGSTGVIGYLTPASLTQDTTYAYVGEESAKVVTTPSQINGLLVQSATGLALAGGDEMVIAGAARLRANAGTTLSQLELRITYTDATTSSQVLADPLWFTTDWRRIDFAGIATTAGKTINLVELYFLVHADVSSAITFWADAFVVEQVESVGDLCGPYFDGDSEHAEWEGTAHASVSQLHVPTITYEGAYVGDANGDNSGSVRIKHAQDTSATPTWVPVPSSQDRNTKEFQALLGTAPPNHAVNRLTNPSAELGIEGWTTFAGSLSQTDDAQVSGVYSFLIDANAGTNAGADAWAYVSAGESLHYSVSVRPGGVYSGVSLEAQLFWYDTSGVLVSNDVIASHAIDAATWTRLSGTVVVPANAIRAKARVLMTGTLVGTEWCYFDAVQLYAVVGGQTYPYLDGDSAGCAWDGEAHQSATRLGTLRFNTAYDVELTITDPDGVASGNPRSDTVNTVSSPTFPFTIVYASAVPRNTTMSVELGYLGDDDDSSTVKIEYKRSDLATWVLVSPVYSRHLKRVTATITNLIPGASYNVRITVDDEDLVYGENPWQATVITLTESESSGTQSAISFGGFVLQGPPGHPYWVTGQDSPSHPDRRIRAEVLPRLDGGVETSVNWGMRRITISGGVEGQDRADLYTKIGALRSALAPRLQRLVIDTMADTGYFFTATCARLDINEEAGRGNVHALWDAEFHCADPFRYEPWETTEENVALTSGEWIEVLNSGDIEVPPVFTLTTDNPLSSQVQLTNITSGERILVDAPIMQGDVLVIDSVRMSATKNSIEVDYAGGFPRLVPGANRVMVTLSQATDSVVISVRRRHRYL